MKGCRTLYNIFYNLRNERGSITIFTLSAMLLLLVTVAISYFGLANKGNSQNADIIKILNEYEKYVANIDDLYLKIYSNKMLFDVKVEKEHFVEVGIKVAIPVQIELTELAKKYGLEISNIEYAFDNDNYENLKKDNTTKRISARDEPYHLNIKVTLVKRNEENIVLSYKRTYKINVIRIKNNNENKSDILVEGL